MLRLNTPAEVAKAVEAGRQTAHTRKVRLDKALRIMTKGRPAQLEATPVEGLACDR
jgi:hypothetical protein